MDAERMLRMAKFLRRQNDGANRPAEVRGREIYLSTPVGALRALYYAPPAGVAAPLMLDLHSGAFIFGSPEEDDDFCAALNRELGAAVVSLDYPLAPEARYPAALEAVYAALLALRDRADEMNIDPQRIGVGGHSAGGNLAAAVCLLARARGEIELKCQMLDCPALDMGCTLPQEARHRDAWEVEQKLLDFGAACYAERAQYAADPLLTPCLAGAEALRGLPPAAVLSCERDSLRTEAEFYAQKLARAGVECRARRLEGARHCAAVEAGEAGAAGRAFLFDALRDWL